MRIDMKKIITILFSHTLWNRDTTALWACAFGKLILFDIIWCLQTTFSSFSIPEVYVNSILVALLLISSIQVMTRGGWQNAFSRLQNANYYTCAVPMYTIFGNLIHQGMQTQAPFTPQMQAEIDTWKKAQPAYIPLSTPSLNEAITDAQHTLCAIRTHTSKGRTFHRRTAVG